MGSFLMILPHRLTDRKFDSQHAPEGSRAPRGSQRPLFPLTGSFHLTWMDRGVADGVRLELIPNGLRRARSFFLFWRQDLSAGGYFKERRVKG